MKRKLVFHLGVRALTILCGISSFAGGICAQSQPGVVAQHALPTNGSRAESDPHAGGHWLDHRSVTDPDLKCAVEEWIDANPKPSLVLVCPPDEVFAPLRLYFKLSWKQEADVPANLRIIAEPKSMIKMRWNSQGDYQVWLPIERKEHKRQPEWVSFNNLVAVYVKSE
jgi:hypothetical protein